IPPRPNLPLHPLPPLPPMPMLRAVWWRGARHTPEGNVWRHLGQCSSHNGRSSLLAFRGSQNSIQFGVESTLLLLETFNGTKQLLSDVVDMTVNRRGLVGHLF